MRLCKTCRINLILSLGTPVTITGTTTHASHSFAIQTYLSMMPNWSCVHDVIIRFRLLTLQ